MCIRKTGMNSSQFCIIENSVIFVIASINDFKWIICCRVLRIYFINYRKRNKLQKKSKYVIVMYLRIELKRKILRMTYSEI